MPGELTPEEFQAHQDPYTSTGSEAQWEWAEQRERELQAENSRPPTPRRVRIYLAIWTIGGALFAILLLASVWQVGQAGTQTAQTYSVVVQETYDRGSGTLGSNPAYVARYSWVVDGITYSGAQQRLDTHDWSDPPSVCYNPNDPSQGTLNSPGDSTCGLTWSPAMWISNVLTMVAWAAVCVFAFWRWLAWRRSISQQSAG
jgi:hypothetical protein